MDNNLFTEWERVIIAIDEQKICGYCTVARTDCIPDVSYTPYIGYMFVGEEYRGNRLSQKLIQYSMDYLKSIGFDRVHIISDHENLYEKYGFEIIDRKIAPWGSMEKIYVQRLLLLIKAYIKNGLIEMKGCNAPQSLDFRFNFGGQFITFLMAILFFDFVNICKIDTSDIQYCF